MPPSVSCAKLHPDFVVEIIISPLFEARDLTRARCGLGVDHGGEER